MSYDLACTVTGATGFVGRHLVKALLEQDDYRVRVFAIDLDTAGELRKNGNHCTFHSWDVTQPLHSAFLGVDVVYHFAGIADPQRYVHEPIKVMDLNVMGLKAILEKIALWDQSVIPRIVYSSTSEVYGLNMDVPFAEDSDMVFGHRLRWCYALSKAVGEMYLRGYAHEHGIRHTIFRFFNFVGADMDAPGAGRVLIQMVSRAMTLEPILVTTPGDQTRCFTHIDDGVVPLVRALTMKYEDPNTWRLDWVMNIGNDEEISMIDLADLVAETLVDRGHLHRRPVVELVSGTELFGSEYDDMQRRQPSTDLAHNILAWEPKMRQREFLPDVIDRIVGRVMREMGA